MYGVHACGCVLYQVETPTHVEEPAGTEPIDEPHDNTVEPPHKGIRKRGVRTGLSAYERTRKPTYHAATAGSENTSEAIAESDEEDDGTIAPDTEGLTRDRSRTGSSIIISGARYLAGMEESGGIRQEEVERLQHTEAVERSRREMFDYRFRSGMHWFRYGVLACSTNTSLRTAVMLQLPSDPNRSPLCPYRTTASVLLPARCTVSSQWSVLSVFYRFPEKYLG
eukprot:m.1172249 g.1172249  ORF g.1172249 m.1172249 type:complete len:224 (+) comp24516_c1_seq7:1930-2601(+)